MDYSVRKLTTTAFMAAVLCVLGPLTLPIGPIPLSLISFGIYLSILILGEKSIIAVLIYLCIGLSGVPVFSGFSAGPGKLLGPTGGYLVGYLFLALVGSSLYKREKKDGRRKKYISLLTGTLLLYVFGMLWMCLQSAISLYSAFMVGVIPFLPGDLFKVWLSVLLAEEIEKRVII